MHTPSDTIHGSPTFHTTIKRVGDVYEARTTVEGVPVVTAPTEWEAITKARQAVEKFIGTGAKK